MNGITGSSAHGNGKQGNQEAGAMGKVTRFMDMHSGGRAKITRNGVDQQFIYIEAPEAAATAVFKILYDRDPDNVTCDCCGEDYSVSEEASLAQATAYERNCAYDDKTREYIEVGRAEWATHVPLDEFLTRDDVTLITKDRILEILGLPS